jgi:hypothetical protein
MCAYLAQQQVAVTAALGAPPPSSATHAYAPPPSVDAPPPSRGALSDASLATWSSGAEPEAHLIK